MNEETKYPTRIWCAPKKHTKCELNLRKHKTHPSPTHLLDNVAFGQVKINSMQIVMNKLKLILEVTLNNLAV